MGNQSSSSPVIERKADPKAAYLMKVLMVRESSIIVKDDRCIIMLAKFLGVDPNEDNAAQELLSSLNEFLLKEKLQKQYYDVNLMNAVRCMLTVGLMANNYLEASPFVKEIFNNIRHLGNMRPEGYAMSAGIKSVSDVFVIKTPRPGSDDSLIHEYFVANGGSFTDEDGNAVIIRGTNYLRKLCLNYSQIVGGFQCGPPDIDPQSGRVKSWCGLGPDDQYMNYVVYEKIPGRDVAEFCKTMTMPHFLSMMFQICYALELGEIINGFTHYDLHYENVIMRPATDNGRPALIPFKYGKTMLYVRGVYIPTIIDYGRSHIQSVPPSKEETSILETEHYGYIATFSKSYGIYNDRARPFHDIYKFLCFVLFKLMELKNPIFDRAALAMKFFGFPNRKVIRDYLKAFRDTTYSLVDPENEGMCFGDPAADYCKNEFETRIGDFITFLGLQFPGETKDILVRDPLPGEIVIECGQECLDPNDTFKSIIYEETPAQVSQLLYNNIDRNTPQGVFDILVFRENLKKRYEYFMFKFDVSDSDYYLELKAVLESLNRDFDEKDVNLMRNYLEEKIRLSRDAFNMIRNGIQYDTRLNLNDEETKEKLLMFDEYLELSSLFSQRYADMIEALEYYSILWRLVRPSLYEEPEELKKLIFDTTRPHYEFYRKNLGSLSMHMEMMKVNPDYEYFLQKLQVKAM